MDRIILSLIQLKTQTKGEKLTDIHTYIRLKTLPNIDRNETAAKWRLFSIINSCHKFK